MFLIGNKHKIRTLRIKRARRKAFAVPVLTLAILSIGIFVPFYFEDNHVDALIDLTGGSTITMTSTKDAAAIIIDPSFTGVFETTSGNDDIAFSVSTTNYTGYVLTARSTTTTLNNNSFTFASLSSAVTAQQFADGNNTTLNGRWGYKPSFYNSESNDKYYGSSVEAVVLDRTSTANSTAKEYTISLGARANSAQPSGTYINDNFVLEAVANVVPTSILTVNYGAGVSEITIGGTVIPDGETVKLIRGVAYNIDMTASEDYAFGSWDADYGVIGSASTKVTTYTISSNDATLTAYATFTGNYIQNYNSISCTTTPSKVYDRRDMQVYHVVRLDDGNCWMVENLNLGAETLTTDLTSDNTNIASTVSASTFNGWRKTTATGEYEDGVYVKTNTTDTTTNTKHGVVYNFYAATAGTVSGSSSTGNSTYDICPAGWRLPTGGPSGEQEVVYGYYSENGRLTAAVSNGGAGFTRAGYFTSGSISGTYNYGYYWSSTNKDNGSSYALYISGTTYATTTSGISRYYGLSVRCVLKDEGISELDYLQDFAALSTAGKNRVIASMDMNKVYELADNRDNQTYDIARLKDGQVWMTENLNLGAISLSTDLTSANTNLSTTITATTFNNWKENQSAGTLTAGEYISFSGTDATSGTPYGTMYNYYTATAGTISGNENSFDANYDICPASWRLPTGTDDGELKGLVNKYGTGTKPMLPVAEGGAAFAKAGYYTQYTVPSSQGTLGYYWTSSMYGTNKTSVGKASTSSFLSNNGGENQYGYSIRCILKKNSSTVTVNYGTGVSSVIINADVIANGGTFVMEQGRAYELRATLDQNYEFDGWTASSGTIGGQDVQYTTYTIGSNNSTITASATAFNGPNIQNLSASSCTSTPIKAKDVRDGQLYTIQRLDDGNCWMMENLNLGVTSLSVDLTSSNTNVRSTVTTSTFNGWKNQTGMWTGTPVFASQTGVDTVTGTAYGSLYNYYAATAGTFNNFSVHNPTQDICPAGWRLPTGGATGEFQVLANNYTGYRDFRNPIPKNGLAFALSGWTYGSPPYYQKQYGYYYSSTVDVTDKSKSSVLYLTNTSTTPSRLENTSEGLAIRCIMKQSSSTLTVSYGTGVASVYINGDLIADGDSISLEQGIEFQLEMFPSANYVFGSWSVTSGTLGSTSSQYTTYTIGSSNATLSVTATAFSGPDLQNISSSSCTTTASQAKDNRDGQVYTIKRLDDGNCWMIDSLNLGAYTLANDLTSANTNLSTPVAATTFNGWKKTSNLLGSYTDGAYIKSPGNIDRISKTPFNMLYTYYAASAGTVSGDSYTNNAIHDICPAGWRLPTGGTGGEYETLSGYYSTPALARAPLSESGAAFPLSGYVNYRNPTQVGSTGYYWSSTNKSGSEFYTYVLGLSYTGPKSSHNRTQADSIRCILKDASNNLTISYGFGVESVTVNGVAVSNGEVINTGAGATYTVEVTPATGYTFTGWTSTSGTIDMSNSVSTAFTIGSTAATLTPTVNFPGPDIQNLSSSSCTSTPIQVKDTRDGHLYIVQRLDDGNCWMMENLDLGRTALTTNLTGANTNIANTVTATTFNSWRKTAGTGTYTNGEVISVTGTDGTSGTDYGTLYNYHAASAGTITGSSNTGNAEYDICPAGWRLPTGSSIGEYEILYENSSYDTNAEMRASITNSGAAFSLPGYFTNFAPTSSGSVAYYWTSTAHDTTRMNAFYISTSSVAPALYFQRNGGGPIRCILKEPKTISKLKYLQNFNTLESSDYDSVLNSMSYDTTYSLKDMRDNKTYAIAKLRDGNIWMTDNLDLGRTNLVNPLTPINTNIVTTISETTFNGWKTTSAIGTNDAGEFYNVTGTDELNGTAYGTLYNYYAATAGTISGSTINNNANHDICPAGWRLPTGGTYGEFKKLYDNTAYNTPDKIRATVANGGAALSLPGVIWTGTPEYTTYFASYWTSTKQSINLAGRLSMNKTSVGADSSDNRTSSFSIRCIAKMKPASITDYTYMQEFQTLNTESKAMVVNSMADNTEYSLTDARDNKTYTVAKLKDDNIWMSQNLDLGRTSPTLNLTFTNTNSNTTVQNSVFYGWKKTAGTGTYTAGEYISLNGTDTTNGKSYGSLYNYYAVSATTISGTSSTVNAADDICPGGWRLPTGGSSGEFNTLYGYYNTPALMRASIANGGASFAFSGYFPAGSPTGQGSDGGFWSSTANGANSMYILYISSSSVQPASVDGRNNGEAVRCIAK